MKRNEILSAIEEAMTKVYQAQEADVKNGTKYAAMERSLKAAWKQAYSLPKEDK